MLIESKLNLRTCHESIRLSANNETNMRVSWLIESTHHNNIYFVYRNWSKIEVVVEIFGENYTSSHQLDLFERLGIIDNLNKKPIRLPERFRSKHKEIRKETA